MKQKLVRNLMVLRALDGLALTAFLLFGFATYSLLREKLSATLAGFGAAGIFVCFILIVGFIKKKR